MGPLCIFFLIIVALPGFISAQSLFLLGGDFQPTNEEAWNRLIDAAGGKEKARFGVMAPGVDCPECTGGYYTSILVDTYGVNATYIDIRPENDLVNDPETARLVRSMTGFFFAGGVKSKIVYTLIQNGQDTVVMSAIRQVLRDGGVFAGSSAACGCQSGSVMLINGDSWLGFRDGAIPQTGIEDPYPNSVLVYDPTGGLQLFYGFVLDAHFSERGREGRIARVIQQTRNEPGTGVAKGIAVDEDTALILTGFFTGRLMGEVIGTGHDGKGGVTIIDATNTIEHPSDTTNYENISWTYLTLGDKIDFVTGQVTFPDWKSNIAGAEELDRATPSVDITGAYQWSLAAKNLMNNKVDEVIDNYSSRKDPEFQVVFDRRPATRYGGFRPDMPQWFFLSYTNMTVHIHESGRQL